MGATPAWWQLLKAFYEEGIEIVAVPFRGRPIRTLWWKSYENPCYYIGEAYAAALSASKRFKLVNRASGKKPERLIPRLSSQIVRPRWERHIKRILTQEHDIGAIICLNLPLNQLTGLPSKIKDEFDVPIVYYDGDLPVSLPSHGGYTFNSYIGADLGEYDSFIVNSGGAAPTLREMGAQKTCIVHWGVDPTVYFPTFAHKDIDVFFSGLGTKFREKWIEEMIRIPAQSLDNRFVVSGIEPKVLGPNVKSLPFLPFSEWTRYCWRSKISLNIARESHALTPETSSSRPFELAALGSCVISNPYVALSDWFEIGTEVFTVQNHEEAVETYRWLIQDDEARQKAGQAARERVLNQHTCRHRAREIMSHLSTLS